jgi:hypothetical protein
MVETGLAADGFEALLRKVMFRAFEAGKHTLEGRGFRVPDIREDERAYRQFIRACHHGYDKAQELIGQSVIDYEDSARTAEAEARAARSSGATRTARNLLARAAVLRSRQLILRRVLDAILYLALMPDEWILRHATAARETRLIDPVVVRRTLDVARQMNQRSRWQFHVVVDIATAVQLGDLILIDRTPPGPGKWKAIELKGGVVNEVLGGLLEESKGQADAAAAETQARSAFGEKGVKQFRRMARQEQRLRELERLRATDTAEDPLYKVEMHVTPDTVRMASYVDVLGRAVKRAAEAGIAGESLDGCLHILALTGRMWEFGGAGAVAHALFHAAKPSEPCLIGDRERRSEELAELPRIDPIIDIVAYSMQVQWGMPVFLWPLGLESVSDHIADMVLGRIRVFAYLDIEAFFRLAAERNIELSWITGRDAEEIKRFSTRLRRAPDAWGVRARTPDGGVQDLLSGFFARLFGHYATPRQLVEMIEKFPAQQAR